MGSACPGKEPLDPAERQRQKAEAIQNSVLNDLLAKGQRDDRETIKLLFLGAGESGKSTLLKQMTIINGSGFSDEERKFYVSLVHSNILQSMKVLLKRQIEFAETEAKYSLPAELEEAKNHILEMKFDESLTPKSAAYVDNLWHSPVIQAVYDRRSEYQLNDSTSYFFGRLAAVMAPGYLPNDQDILRARIRTTGIVEHRFEIEKNEFRMFDVGGQRNARKKWIHCFENVTAVIFVAAISGYDEKLAEDNDTNRLHEALNLFEDICDSKWFKNTSLILFLNKKDIFKEKIKKVPLTVCFPYYVGSNDYRSGLKFIKEEFKARNRHPEKKIFTHFTTATDTSNIRRVFQYVKSIILRAHLIDIGLMDPRTDVNNGYQSGDDLKDEEDEPVAAPDHK